MKKKIKIIGLVVFVVLLIMAVVVLYPLIYKGTSDIQIIEDRTFSSLKEIMNQDKFKNKIVFVDIWGTYCRPCLKEFDHASELKERYNGKPVEFLYLCVIDRVDQKIRWKDIIKKKQLFGYHVPIDEKLYENIWMNDLGDKVKDKFLIPHYFIAKNGQIVVYQAAFPSSKEKLYNQIDSVMHLQ